MPATAGIGSSRPDPPISLQPEVVGDRVDAYGDRYGR